MKKIFYIFIFFFVINGCKSTQTNSQSNVIISIEKTACLGSCPVYTLKIYENRSVQLEANDNLDKKGTYNATISEERLEELIKLFKKYNFFEFESSYTSRMSDRPTTYLYFSQGNKNHRVEDYDNAPQDLKKLENEVASLLDTLDWKKN